MVRIAVFASGSGSNYEAIMQYFTKLTSPKAEIALLVCDQPGAGVLERAAKWHTPVLVVERRRFASKKQFEQYILAQLQQYQIDFIALAGYMRLLGPTLLDHYLGRVINLHPSLLPAFPGIDAVGQALKAGVRVTGVTVHFVDYGMDTGPIIVQKPVAVELDDTHNTLSSKIHVMEHELYPKIVYACALGRIYLDGTKVCWQNPDEAVKE